ncbi:riboflavin synthase [Vibrio tritonius]|uniref:hypothetical protein n=1 Tax=Vibrio tritonius TaxID=1435069 RepID=UPI000838F8D1|nr:hypothetical protein [Vibrio tritonius]
MFSGVVQSLGKVLTSAEKDSSREISLRCHHDFYLQVAAGQWVCVDGGRFCVTQCQANDVLVLQAERYQENDIGLISVQPGAFVHLTCADQQSKDRYGHRLTGNIDFKAQINDVDMRDQQRVYQLSFPNMWHRYLVVGCRVALNGASVSVLEVDQEQNVFTVSLANTASQMSVFGQKFVGDWLNVEIERGSQKVIETLRSSLSDTLGDLYPAIDSLLALQGLDFDFLGARAKAKALDEIEHG